MTSGTSHRERLVALIEPAVAAAGYDLERVSVTAAGRRRVVQIVVDADPGISLDQVAEVSRVVSGVLDKHDDVLGGYPYVLEVTSPGVDRPLTQPRHWRRAVHRIVRVAVAGRGAVEGRVVRADDSGVVLAVAGEELAVPFSDLGRGKVQVEFSRGSDGEEL
jgi:ribosome maturation factor RimP